MGSGRKRNYGLDWNEINLDLFSLAFNFIYCQTLKCDNKHAISAKS